MDTSMFHELRDRDLPDTPGGICCEGSAFYGPGRCTCWVAVYDHDQAAPRTELPEQARTDMCHDCAYRPGSPERRGEPDYRGDEDLLTELAATGKPFWCHQGLRQPIAYRHPCGMEIPANPAEYAPPVVDGRPYKVDGTPGDLCAGWAARRLAALRGAQGEPGAAATLVRMTTWYVVPCSGHKQDHPAQALEFYTGTLYRAAMKAALAEAMRTEAEGRKAQVLILSASYGLVTPRQVLMPYDVTLGSPGQVQPPTLAYQARVLGIQPSAEVHALLPRAYFELLSEGLQLLDAGPQWVFEGCRGIGQMLAVCKQLQEGR